jgi:hypothetical protein
MGGEGYTAKGSRPARSTGAGREKENTRTIARPGVRVDEIADHD